jgi:hypothetical protein
MNDTLVYECGALVAVLILTLFWIQFRAFRTSRAAWAKERRELQALASAKTEEVGVPAAPPEKRTLWRIGDRTEVDLGNGVFSLAVVLDFDDDNDGNEVDALVRFENSQTHSRGFWNVPIDELRKPRAGLPEPLPSVEEPPTVPQESVKP